MKNLFSSLCNNLIDLYNLISRQSKKSDAYAKKISDTNQKVNSWLFRIPILGKFFKFLFVISPSGYYPRKKDHEDLIEELGYKQQSPIKLKELNRASKCYMVLFYPLIIITIVSIFSALFSFAFMRNTILFFDEYVKLIPLIIPFLIIFLWLIPYLFFKLFFSKEKKSIQIYTYGTLVAIILPLLIIPQDYHYYYGKPIEAVGTVTSVYNGSHKQKMNNITFLTNEKKLKKMKLTNLSRYLTDNAKIGEKYIITGRKSKFYFTYDEVKKLGT